VAQPFAAIQSRIKKEYSGLFSYALLLMGVIAAPLGGFWAVRYGEKKWLLTVLGLAYLCFGLAIVAPSNTAFVILYLAYGFLNSLGMAASIAETFGLGTIFYVSTAIFFLSLVVLRFGARVQTS
jgi:MFS family permease